MALDYKLNKSHKKVIKRVNKFLNSGVKPGTHKVNSGEVDDVDGGTDNAVCEITPVKLDEKLAAAIHQDIDYKNLPSSSTFAKVNDTQKAQSYAASKANELASSVSTEENRPVLHKSTEKKIPSGRCLSLSLFLSLSWRR